MPNKIFNNLSGKILIASPHMMHGNMFHKSIIYMLLHSPEGSVGLILNHVVKTLPIGLLLKHLEQNNNVLNTPKLPIHLGGPIELEKIFLLHSDDYNKNLLFKFQDNLAISSNSEILQDIVSGHGPKNSLFMLGYTSWTAKQLEEELENNLWIISDYNKELIFSDAHAEKWDIALKNLGIDNQLFTTNIGHA